MKSVTSTLRDMPSKLSTLWIFLFFNMVFADIFGYTYPGFMAKIVAGGPVDGITITPGLLLISAVITEVCMAMIFLSRFLKRGVNRWVNIAGAVITIAWVTGLGSDMAHYYFFASVEVLTCLVIVGMAWRWRGAEVPAGEADGRLVARTESDARA